MTGPKGNSEFCFPKTLNIPESRPRGTLRVEGKQNSLFPAGPVIECFVIPPNSKIETKPRQILCLTSTGTQICCSFKEHDLITCKSKVQVALSLGR